MIKYRQISINDLSKLLKPKDKKRKMYLMSRGFARCQSLIKIPEIKLTLARQDSRVGTLWIKGCGRAKGTWARTSTIQHWRFHFKRRTAGGKQCIGLLLLLGFSLHYYYLLDWAVNQTTMKKRGRKEPFMTSSKYHCLQMHLFIWWLLSASNGNRMALLQLFFAYSLADMCN